MNAKVSLLPGVPINAVISALSKAAGKELESGKFASEESSSALAVNAFGWFIERPTLLPQLPSAPPLQGTRAVHIEYCARFPWAGGRHPWLDAMIESEGLLIGVESKRFEPFRDRKVASLSTAYDRPVWGERMKPFEQMRDTLREDPTLYQFLDAAQLVKHAFGLVTDSKRKSKRSHLHYLFAEPATRGDKVIPMSALQQHRLEIADFSRRVSCADVSFSACSYREWLIEWRGGAVESHATRLLAAFNP